MEETICKVDSNGNKFWYKNDKQHRDNDEHAVELICGSKAWLIDGKFHRDNNKPAFIYSSGTKEWYVNGKLHRTDGAAIEWSNGYKRWYINDKRIDCYTQEEFEYYMKYKAFL